MIDAILPGLVTSLLIWVLLRVTMRARVLFSREVSVQPSQHTPTKTHLRYLVKAKNVSLFRSVADVQFDAVLRTKGLDQTRPNNILYIPLAISHTEIPVMRPGANRLLTLSVSEMKPTLVARLKDLGHDGLTEQQNWDLRQLMCEAARLGEFDLHGDNGPLIQVNARVQEAWTGRSFSFTKEYKPAELIDARFSMNANPFRMWLGHKRKAGRKFAARLAQLHYRFHPDLAVRTDGGLDKDVIAWQRQKRRPPQDILGYGYLRNTRLMRTWILLALFVPAGFALTAERSHPDIVLGLLLLLPSIWIPIVLTAAVDSGSWRNLVRGIVVAAGLAFGLLLRAYSEVEGTNAFVGIYFAGIVAALLLDLTVKAPEVSP